MQVLVATSQAQGERKGDYCFTVEGELVRFPGLTCDCPDCGCDRGFAGLASSKATTTCLVAEMGVDRAGLRVLFLDTLTREGWIDPDEAEALSWLDDFIDDHIDVAASFPLHTVLELGPDDVRVRRLAPSVSRPQKP